MNDAGEITGYTYTVTLLPCAPRSDCGTFQLVGRTAAGGEASCTGSERFIDAKLLPAPWDPTAEALTYIFLEEATSSSGLRGGCSSSYNFLVPMADGTIALRAKIAGSSEFTVEGTLHRVDAPPSLPTTP
jgi:hypothetical protein